MHIYIFLGDLQKFASLGDVRKTDWTSIDDTYCPANRPDPCLLKPMPAWFPCPTTFVCRRVVMCCNYSDPMFTQIEVKVAALENIYKIKIHDQRLEEVSFDDEPIIREKYIYSSLVLACV